MVYIVIRVPTWRSEDAAKRRLSAGMSQGQAAAGGAAASVSYARCVRAPSVIGLRVSCFHSALSHGQID